jgi:hypothetical protein
MPVMMTLCGVVAGGCGGAGGLDPKVEAQQKVEADAMMKQYESGPDGTKPGVDATPTPQ